MSHLTENPEMMLEALAVLVMRQGGTVTICADECPGPFNLLSKWDGDRLHLVIDSFEPLNEAKA